MIDDVTIASAADGGCGGGAWNLPSLSSSAPGRWSAADPAGHYRRTAPAPGR